MAETHKLRTNDILPKTSTFKEYNKKAEALAKSSTSAPLPSLDHLKLSDYDLVYEPSDDTYLMLDALCYDFDSGNSDTSGNRSKVKMTLELGCGTGVSTIYLASVLQKHEDTKNGIGVKHIVTDINEHAIESTKQTAQQNNISLDRIETHVCDLATPLLQLNNNNDNGDKNGESISYQHAIDVLIFNPPYVPTPNSEVGSNGIEASWAGGTNGRIVLDRALPQIASLLSYPHGVAYVISVDDNLPEEIASIMMKEYGILVQPFVRRRARNEFLSVLKMTLTRRI